MAEFVGRVPAPEDAPPAPDVPAAGLEAAPADRPAAPAPPDSGPRHLDPRVITLNRIGGSIVGVILGGLHLVAVAIALVTADWPRLGLTLFALSWLPVAAGLAWLAWKWPAIDYRHWRYRVSADGIEIWSGVIFRQAVSVPRSRVQHIDVSQGPIERSYGLATLSIHTAGTVHSKVDLPGLDHGVALTVRDALLPSDAESAV